MNEFFVDESGWCWTHPTIRRLRNAYQLAYTVWKDKETFIIYVEVNGPESAVMAMVGYPTRILDATVITFENKNIISLNQNLRAFFMSFLKKLAENSQTKSLLSVHVDEGLQKKYPALYEYLTVDKYPDGSPRETSTLSISVADDGYKFCLRDRDNARCLWATSQTFFDGLKSLDASLRLEEAPWVKDRFSTNGAVKKGVAKKN